jgi:hypothetical protein
MPEWDAPSDTALLPASLRDAALAPLRPRAYTTLVYLALAFPLGLAYFVVTVTGLSVGLGLSVILVGVPILAATLAFVLAAAAVERVLARHLLGVAVPSPDFAATDETGLRDRTVAFLTDTAVWGALVFVVSKLLVGVAAFTSLVVVFSFGLSLLATPLYYDQPGVSVGLVLSESVERELSLVVPWEQFEVGLSFVVRITSWTVSSLPGALVASLVGVVVLVAGLNLLNAGGWLCARWAETTLAPHTTRETSHDSDHTE